MANITVNWSDLSEKGTKMKEKAEDMLDILKDVKEEVVNLNSYWESPAASEMVKYITSMQPKFERYRDIVVEYGKFLEDASDKYSTTENELTKSAHNMLEFN